MPFKYLHPMTIGSGIFINLLDFLPYHVHLYGDMSTFVCVLPFACMQAVNVVLSHTVGSYLWLAVVHAETFCAAQSLCPYAHGCQCLPDMAMAQHTATMRAPGCMHVDPRKSG